MWKCRNLSTTHDWTGLKLKLTPNQSVLGIFSDPVPWRRKAHLAQGFTWLSLGPVALGRGRQNVRAEAMTQKAGLLSDSQKARDTGKGQFLMRREGHTHNAFTSVHQTSPPKCPTTSQQCHRPSRVTQDSVGVIGSLWAHILTPSPKMGKQLQAREKEAHSECLYELQIINNFKELKSKYLMVVNK